MSHAAEKAALRARASERRAALHVGLPGAASAACGKLLELVGPAPGGPVAGYMPMRSEIDPLPAMRMLAATVTVCVPVIRGRGLPLVFHAWTPACEMEAGAFGALVPRGTPAVAPEILIVPLLAFDRAGRRLGYGGGFYDRTLAGLRARGPVLAVGLAFAGQEVDTVPHEPTDARLDAIVTEAEVIRPE